MKKEKKRKDKKRKRRKEEHGSLISCTDTDGSDLVHFGCLDACISRCAIRRGRVLNTTPYALLHFLSFCFFFSLRFNSFADNHLADPQNRRLHLERYAAKKGFDPLVPQNWYSITRKTLEGEVSSSFLFFLILFFLTVFLAR